MPDEFDTTDERDEYEAYLDSCYAEADDIATEQYVHEVQETAKMLAGGAI